MLLIDRHAEMPWRSVSRGCSRIGGGDHNHAKDHGGSRLAAGLPAERGPPGH